MKTWNWRFGATAVLGIGLGLVPLGKTLAEPFELTHTLLNPDTAPGGWLGWSVALSNDQALVGAPTVDRGTGAAYLFDAATGSFIRDFSSPFPMPGGNFGLATALSSGRALIGARYDKSEGGAIGAAHLFDVSTGTLLHTFANPNLGSNDHFGSAVALSGNRALVGAFADNANGTNAGTAYLFDTVTGSLLKTFVDPEPMDHDSFGGSVALFGDQVLIGVENDDTKGFNAGLAYLFDAATGNLLNTFASPQSTGHFFGVSVALSADRALIGAHRNAIDSTVAGAAYLFDTADGALLQTFSNPAPAFLDQFGISVALSGDRALIGANLDDFGSTDAGAAYLFDASDGALLQSFMNPVPASNAQFGTSVAMSGEYLAVGSPFDRAGGYTDAGTAYLYNLAAGDSATVPEPATLALLGAGLSVFSLAGVCRSRRSARPGQAAECGSATGPGRCREACLNAG